MLLFFTLASIFFTLASSQEIVSDYPTLPTLWNAETIEPGSPDMGHGSESYDFVDSPTPENPSGIWSNYTDCQRLIYIPSKNTAKRYLLGCDAVNCCWEDQDGNHVEFQIPNVQYSNPQKNVDVYYQRANVTNFGERIEADEWSWSWTFGDKLSQDWRAYTVVCDNCVGGIQLIQWQSRAMNSEWFPVQFKNYRGMIQTHKKDAIFCLFSACQMFVKRRIFSNAPLDFTASISRHLYMTQWMTANVELVEQHTKLVVLDSQ